MKKVKELILIGGGGHCSACIDVIELQAKYKIIGILDGSQKIGGSLLNYPYIGTDDDIEKYINKGYYFLITIGHLGSPKRRKELFKKVDDLNGKFATVVSPIAYIAKSVIIGKGTIIMHHALININTQIDENCIINSKSLIEHDCHIQNNCHIATASTINGNVVIGESSFFGSNAVCKQGSVIKKHSFTKSNSCFTNNNPANLAVLTTIYPMEKQFVLEFFKSLQDQSDANFTIIVVNDGFQNFHHIKALFPNLRIIELPAAGSIAKNREHLLLFAKSNNYQQVIFADSDDTFSSNRVDLSRNALLHFDIVVNDLTTMQASSVINENIFSQRLVNNSSISLELILDKNLFGLSNTAINLEKVPFSLLKFPNELIAVDWYLFSLLLFNGLSARFTSDCITYYRQHTNNTIGMVSMTSATIKHIIQTKEIHYKSLQKHSSKFASLLNETLQIKEIISNEATLNSLIRLNSNMKKTLFWWELQVNINEIN